MKNNYFAISKTKDKELAKKLKTDLIFREQTKRKCIDFLTFLGFDLTKEYIYAFIDKDNFNSLAWRETQNHFWNKSFFDVKNRKYESKLECFVIEEKILNHAFPLELKNKVKFKNKTFYHNNVDTETLYNMSYCSNTIMGGYLKDVSNILCVDIDNHNKKGSLYTYEIKNALVEFMKAEPIYMEISYHGGYHLYFKLDREMSLYEKKTLALEFKEKYKYEIEIPIKMRFPNCVQYIPINHHAEIFSYLDAIDRAYELYNIQMVSTNTKINTLPIKEKIKTVQSSIYSRRFQSSKNKISIDDFIKNPTIEISTGNRVQPMLTIIRIGKANNWSIDDICKAIYTCNNPIFPSKDLSRWSYKTLYHQVENTFKRCSIKTSEYSSSKPENFISNIKYIPSHILAKIDKNFITLLIQQIQNNSNEYKATKKNINSFTIILKEMIGSMYYNAKNNKTVKHEFFKKHLIGMQYSTAFAVSLKQHYKKELETTDVWGIINIILKYSTLFVQYKANKRGWYFNSNNKEKNFCRQFDLSFNTNHKILNDTQTISLLLYHSINNFIKKYILNSSIKIKNNIITIYTEYFNFVSSYFISYFRSNSLLLYDS